MRHSYALLFLLTALLTPLMGRAQSSVGIGTTSPDPKAALDISATGKGLLIPRMDSATRAGITAPPDGLMVFQTDGRKGFWYAVSGAWVYIPDKTKSGDNLGSHTATQNLNLNGNKLTGGGTSGLEVSSAGTLTVDALTGSSSRLVTTNDAGELSGAGAQNGLVLNGGAVKLGGPLTDTTTLLDAPTGGQVVQLRTTNGQSSTVAGPAYQPGGSGGGTSILGWVWQPFEMTVSGVLNSATVRTFVNTAGGTLIGTLFAGSDIYGGTPLGSASVAITNTGLQNLTLTWLTPPTVVAGQFYSLRLERSGNGSLSWLSSRVGVPSGWTNGSNTGAYLFSTIVTTPPVLQGVTLQNGLVTLDGLSGTGPRMVTAAADGTLAAQPLPTDAQQLTKSGTTISLTNGGSVTDSDNQTLVLSGSTISLSNGGTVTLPDASATNEIQTLGIAGSTISLSNGGGSVTVPSSADNLGNHAATQNINLGANLLTGGGSTGVRVTSGGLVGIGTATPGGLLHLVGSDATTNGFGAALRLQNTAATTANTWTVRAGGAGTATPDGGFSIADNNNYRLSITNGGLVGIGTTAPAARLTVSGADATTHGKNAAITLQNTSASTANTWTVRAGGTGTATPDGGFSIGDDNNYRFSITNSGLVGVGTTAPAALLHVSGAETSANGRNAAIRLANTAATTPNSWIMRAGGGGTSTPDGGFSIADDNAYRLTITAAGRVGIGTTAPASELDVDGNLRLQGQSSTTEGLLVADAQGDVQRARHYAYTKSSLPGGASTIHTRTHNLGYAPIWLISIECDVNFPTLSVTYENTSVNQTVFHVFNHGLLPLDYTIHAFPVQ